MKKVLITGGAGFIGSHVAEGYSKKGYEVIIVDNLSSGSIDNISNIIHNENVYFYNVDIRDYEKLEEVFQKHTPNIINHHAAQKSVPYSVINPNYDISINIIGFMNLIKLAKNYQVSHFITVSSGGALSKLIIGNERSKESDFPQLESPYAINKFSSEQYLKLYAQEFGFDYSILRYANVYGPRQIPDGECGVIPIFLENIINASESVLMTYNDMPRGCTRDYVFVYDVVEANMLVTENPINDVVNIGSGKEIAILDIYEEIENVFNKKIPISIAEHRPGDIKRSVLDCEKAKSILKWECKTSLKDGLMVLKETL